MADELFTGPWAEAWCRRINASDAYREAAEEWEGAVVFRMEADGAGDRASGRSVWLDLWHGECRGSREATEEDLDSAPYVLSAGRESWEALLEGELSPMAAVAGGKVELVRGSLVTLARFTQAARELVKAAGRVEDASRGGENTSPGGDRPRPNPDTGESDRASEVLDAAATAAPHATVAGAAATATSGRRRFRSTSPGGLDRSSFLLRLWEKSKRLGTWNPSDVDLSRDVEDWRGLADGERDLLLRLASLFQAGEEAVTVDLLPFLRMVAEKGELEEEMYLTAFLWEEAKHVDAFRRFFDEVAGEDGDLSRYHTPSYREVFYRELPSALERLAHDRSTEARAEATVTYHLFVEGVLAETGYHTYVTILERNGILPGTQELVRRVSQDESRHLAYGVYSLAELVREAGDPAWAAVEGRMEELMPLTVGIIEEAFAAYEVVPFGLEPDDFIDYALSQVRKRLERVESARDGGAGAGFGAG